MIKNKKGVSIVEILAAIVIVGIAFSTITSLMFISLKTSLKSKQRLLAYNASEMYTVFVANNMPTYDNVFNEANLGAAVATGDQFVIATGKDATSINLCKSIFGEESVVYKTLYDDSYTNKIVLNNTVYDAKNVKIVITIKNATYKTIRITTSIAYSNESEVTFSHETYIG